MNEPSDFLTHLLVGRSGVDLFVIIGLLDLSGVDLFVIIGLLDLSNLTEAVPAKLVDPEGRVHLYCKEPVETEAEQ